MSQSGDVRRHRNVKAPEYKRSQTLHGGQWRIFSKSKGQVGYDFDRIRPTSFKQPQAYTKGQISGTFGKLYAADEFELITSTKVVHAVFPRQQKKRAKEIEHVRLFKSNKELAILHKINCNRDVMSLNVASMKQFYDTSNGFIVVLHGKTLSIVKERIQLRGKPMHPEEATICLQHLLNGLKFVHQQLSIPGVVTIDTVVLNCKTGAFLLTDFTGTCKRTCCIECKSVKNGARRSQGSTVWDLAITMELFTNFEDTFDATKSKVLSKLLYGQMRLKSSSNLLETILAKMLEQEIEKRPTAGQLCQMMHNRHKAILSMETGMNDVHLVPDEKFQEIVQQKEVIQKYSPTRPQSHPFHYNKSREAQDIRSWESNNVETKSQDYRRFVAEHEKLSSVKRLPSAFDLTPSTISSLPSKFIQRSAAGSTYVSIENKRRFSYKDFIFEGQISQTMNNGEVRAAWQISQRRRVAIKLMSKRDKLAFVMFQREYDLLAKCDNEYVLETHGYIDCHDRFGIVMPMCIGTMMSKQATYDEATLAMMWHDVLSGLCYLHNVADIAHRDIKPANIFITHDNVYKLADFGLSCKATRRRTSIVGTNGFRAPEMAPLRCNKNAAEYDGKKADLWSLGQTFYVILNDGHFFQAHNASMLQKENYTTDKCTAIEKWVDVTLHRHCLLREPQARTSCANLLRKMSNDKMWPQKRTFKSLLMITSDCGNDDITESSTFVPIEQTTVRPPTNDQMLRGQPRSNRKMKIIYEQTATWSDGANLAAFKAVDATYEYSDSSTDEVVEKEQATKIVGKKLSHVQQTKAVDATYEYSSSSSDEKATAHIGGHKVAQVQQRKAKVVEKEQATKFVGQKQSDVQQKDDDNKGGHEYSDSDSSSDDHEVKEQATNIVGKKMLAAAHKMEKSSKIVLCTWDQNSTLRKAFGQYALCGYCKIEKWSIEHFVNCWFVEIPVRSGFLKKYPVFEEFSNTDDDRNGPLVCLTTGNLDKGDRFLTGRGNRAMFPKDQQRERCMYCWYSTNKVEKWTLPHMMRCDALPSRLRMNLRKRHPFLAFPDID